MKTLKLITVVLVVIALLFSFASCKKGKNNENKGGSSSFNFKGDNRTITKAFEKHIDGDIFLEFAAGDTGDHLQIVFAKAGDTLTEGDYTYHGDRFSQSYNPKANFWTGGAGLAGVSSNITGGTLTIAKDGDGYKMTFDIDTADGKVTGEYNGTPTKI